MDESSFNVWSSSGNKMWMPYGMTLSNQIQRIKHPNVTVYGSISTALKHPVWMLGASTNKLEFQKYLKKLKNQIPQNLHHKCILMFDGAKAHVAKETL